MTKGTARALKFAAGWMLGAALSFPVITIGAATYIGLVRW